MVREFRKSAAREARALAILLLVAVAYVAGGMTDDCWPKVITIWSREAPQ